MEYEYQGRYGVNENDGTVDEGNNYERDNGGGRPLVGRTRQSMSNFGRSVGSAGRRGMSRRRMNSAAHRSISSLETVSTRTFEDDRSNQSSDSEDSWINYSEREEHMMSRLLTIKSLLAIGTVLVTIFILIGGGYYVHERMSKALAPANIANGGAPSTVDVALDESNAPSIAPNQALRSRPVIEDGSMAPSIGSTNIDSVATVPHPPSHESTAATTSPTEFGLPHHAPTSTPSKVGLFHPTEHESMVPTSTPSKFGMSHPTEHESTATSPPTKFTIPRFYQPSSQPSVSSQPSQSSNPSSQPSQQPSVSNRPTPQLSSSPSLVPSVSLSGRPSSLQTQVPTESTAYPTSFPTSFRVHNSYQMSKRFVTENNGMHPDPGFGKDVQTSRDYFLIGAPDETRVRTSDGFIGAAYIFRRPGDQQPRPGMPSQIDMYAYHQVNSIPSESAINIQFGASVAISEDSSIIAIGAPGYPCDPNDDNSHNCGKVEIYQLTNQGIQKQAYPLVGQPGYLFGSSVDLSDDGSILTVASAVDNGGSSGDRLERVDIFSFDSTNQTWSIVGNSIQAEPYMHSPTVKTAISGDGRTVAMVGNGEYGYARVYEFSREGFWLQKGTDIATSEQWNDMVKTGALSLSSDGTMIGIGVTSSMGIIACDSSPSDCHHDPGTSLDDNVVIFNFSEDDWTQVGNNLHGWSLSLSRNGRVVAVGCRNHNEGDGEVGVRRLVGAGWEQIGSPLKQGPYSGVEHNQLGSVVEISNDSHLVIGGGSNLLFLWKR